MLRAGLDDEGGGADEALKAGAFFEGDRAGAEDLAADVAVDAGRLGGDGVEELDAHSFFHAEVAAENAADNLTAAADDDLAGAFHRAGELADDGEVVALDVRAGDDSGFLDDDIATSLDAAVPRGGDVVVQQADVAAAFRALAGLGLADGGVGVAAVEAGDLARWLDRIEQPHQERAGCRDGGGLAEEGRFGHLWRWLGVRIAILARGGEAGGRVFPHHAFSLTHLEIRPARPALRGDHECRFGL